MMLNAILGRLPIIAAANVPQIGFRSLSNEVSPQEDFFIAPAVLPGYDAQLHNFLPGYIKTYDWVNNVVIAPYFTEAAANAALANSFIIAFAVDTTFTHEAYALIRKAANAIPPTRTLLSGFAKWSTTTYHTSVGTPSTSSTGSSGFSN